MVSVRAGPVAGCGSDSHARGGVDRGRSGAERELVVPLPAIERVQDSVVTGGPCADRDDSRGRPAGGSRRIPGAVVPEGDQGRHGGVALCEVVQPSVLEAESRVHGLGAPEGVADDRRLVPRVGEAIVPDRREVPLVLDRAEQPDRARGVAARRDSDDLRARGRPEHLEVRAREVPERPRRDRRRYERPVALAVVEVPVEGDEVAVRGDECVVPVHRSVDIAVRDRHAVVVVREERPAGG